MTTKPSAYSIEEVRRLSGPRLAEMVQAACTLDTEGFDTDVIDYPDKKETYASAVIGNDLQDNKSIQFRIVLGARAGDDGRVGWGYAISARGREPGQDWGGWELGGRLGFICPTPGRMLDILRSSAAWRRVQQYRALTPLEVVRIADLSPTIGEFQQWEA